MDNWDKRVQVMVFIWGAFALAVGLSGLGDADNAYSLGIAIVAALAALVSTAVVWIYESDVFKLRQEAKWGVKGKREAGQDVRAQMLLELLDENERRALKQQLLADLRTDGEAVTLADLLSTQEASRQHRT